MLANLSPDLEFRLIPGDIEETVTGTERDIGNRHGAVRRIVAETQDPADHRRERRMELCEKD